MDDLLFLSGQNYDCVRCAKGCGAPWRIHVDPYSQRQVSGTPLELRVVQDFGHSFVDDPAGPVVVARKPDGNCVFLGEDRLCGIHGQMGVEAKPIGCRQFPFLIRPTPDGISVGVSFFCTAVQRNEGRPLEVHGDEVREIMKGIRFKPLGEEPIPVYGDRSVDWAGYRAIESHLVGAIDAHGFQAGIGQVIWALSRLVARGDELSPGALAAAVAAAVPGQLEGDSVIVSQNEFLTAALIAMLESPSPEITRQLTEALLEGHEPVSLPRFGWSGLSLEIEFRRESMVGARLDGEIERYLRALIHRKFLAMERPLLANLAVLYLVPRVLRTYTAISSLARAAAEPEIADYYRALDVVEVDLVTHTKGLDALYAALADSFFRQIAAVEDRS